MVNLAREDEVVGSEQLADTEISRILSALQNAEFKKSEPRNARPDQTFKPRSLMEIAALGQQQEEAETANLLDKSLHPEGSVSDFELQNDENTDALEKLDVLEQVAVDEVTEAPVLQPLVSNKTDDEPNEIAEAPALKPLVSNGTSDLASSQDAVASSFETAQSAHDRGYAEGVLAGRIAGETEMRAALTAEAEEIFSNKIKAFDNALSGLLKPQSIDTTTLSQSLQATVVKLATARAGVAIDDLPELMVNRIDALAEAAGKKVSTGRVFLHPDDCAAIGPIISAKAEKISVGESLELQRGDIRIKFDGIEIDDLIEQRLAVSDSSASASERAEPEVLVSSLELQNEVATDTPEELEVTETELMPPQVAADEVAEAPTLQPLVSSEPDEVAEALTLQPLVSSEPADLPDVDDDGVAS